MSEVFLGTSDLMLRLGLLGRVRQPEREGKLVAENTVQGWHLLLKDAERFEARLKKAWSRQWPQPKP